jgi:hypothetical protein
LGRGGVLKVKVCHIGTKSPRTSASQNLSGEPFFQQSDRSWREATTGAMPVVDDWHEQSVTAREKSRCRSSAAHAL